MPLDLVNPQKAAAGLQVKQTPLGFVPGLPAATDSIPTSVNPIRSAASQYVVPIVPVQIPVTNAPVRILAENLNRTSVILRGNALSGSATMALLVGGPGARLPSTGGNGLGIPVNGFEALTLETTDEIWVVNIGIVPAFLGGVELVSKIIQP